MATWDYSAFWHEGIEQLKEEFSSKKRLQEFDMWFSPVEYVNSKESAIVVACPSKFLEDNFVSRGYAAAVQKNCMNCPENRSNLNLLYALRTNRPIKAKKPKAGHNTINKKVKAKMPIRKKSKNIPICAKIIRSIPSLWEKTIRLHITRPLPFQKTPAERTIPFSFTAASVWEKHT